MEMIGAIITPKTYIDAFNSVKAKATTDMQKIYEYIKSSMSSSIIVNTKANDPFDNPPPFDVVAPLPPTPYIPPYNGYTITNQPNNGIDSSVANSDLYYVIPTDTGNVYSKAPIGVTLKPWVPAVDSYFANITVTHCDYSIINDNLVNLTFDMTFHDINNVSADSSIPINLPILAMGNKVFESTVSCEVGFETAGTVQYGGGFTDGRIVAAGDKLIFYVYVFEKQRAYRIRGQVAYMLENRPASNR